MSFCHDTTTACRLMDEIFMTVRDYPKQYNNLSAVRSAVIRDMSRRHSVQVLPDRSLLIDHYHFQIRSQRLNNHLFDIICTD